MAMKVATFFRGEATAFIGGPEPAGVGFGDDCWSAFLAGLVRSGVGGVKWVQVRGERFADSVHLYFLVNGCLRVIWKGVTNFIAEAFPDAHINGGLHGRSYVGIPTFVS